MIADSFKFKGHPCFKNQWSGFDEFKPITVIIGRNNTGKSQLLDVMSALTTIRPHAMKLAYSCVGVLDEDSLKSQFPVNVTKGILGGNHWYDHGRSFEGKTASWSRESSSGKVDINVAGLGKGVGPEIEAERRQRLETLIGNATSRIFERKFRRLLADRDMGPESADVELSLASDGEGATNIIRRVILSTAPEMREELVQRDLLRALQWIFGEDATFSRIEPREDENEKLWEVFLEEPKKGLVPLRSSGSGLKTVILVLLNLLFIPELEKEKKEKYIFAFEELENNLHPALLRRLFTFLVDFVEREKCMLVLTTHSNVALDFFGPRPDTQIIHVTHDGESARTRTVAAHFDHVGLLTELGSRPSDLLQANGVIWLEGPSDRIYFNRFIELFSNGKLREGRHYQCAFYGGSNLANSTFSAPEDADDTFTNLLRLNSNIAVICDGDRTAAKGSGSRIKGRVQRIKKEVDAIPSAFLWITEAKEIENYIPGSVWGVVYEVSGVPDPGPYDRFPGSDSKATDFVQAHLKRKTFDKCEFAMKVAPHLSRESLSTRFDFRDKMNQLVARIREWNK